MAGIQPTSGITPIQWPSGAEGASRAGQSKLSNFSETLKSAATTAAIRAVVEALPPVPGAR